MPLFSSRKPEEHVEHEPVHEEPKRQHSIFNRNNRSPSPVSTTRTSHSSNTNSSTSTTNTGRKSILSRFGHGHDSELDPSIVQAQERVMRAETAERDADLALANARREVREARESAKALDVEAKEEARKAKIKSYHAHEVTKRQKQLGRHEKFV